MVKITDRGCKLRRMSNLCLYILGNGADECTSGFMSVDRMDFILGNEGSLDYRHNYQGIFPEINFTCNGSIQSWIFGARWKGNIDSFTELQIWRPVSGDDEAYTLVGNTTIITEENTTKLYHYPLSSPLSFQAGDILGIFQPHNSKGQLLLGYEYKEEEDYTLGYFYSGSDSPDSPFTPFSQLNINGLFTTKNVHIIVNVITGECYINTFLYTLMTPYLNIIEPPDCGYGFMSVERMRLVLSDDTENDMHTDRRQQITPDIKFTCDGMITKWIIAAQWQGGSMLYPELQVWRNIGNDSYQKINGTFIEPPENKDNDIYEYDNFTPIPFQSGDILGIFIPQTDSSRLRILSEDVNSPNNYYLSTSDTASVSPYNMIDIQTNPSVMTQGYHPMVTVEIGKNHYYYYTTLTLDYAYI